MGAGTRIIEKDLWDDYRDFHWAMVDSRDLDPVYPVYRALADDLGMGLEDRVRLVLLHVAYYHMGSALVAFSATNSLADMGSAPLPLPCATERRGHRNPAALSAHLNSIARRADEIVGWCRAADRAGPGGWGLMTDRLETVHGNGRWAAYKTAEMFQHILPLPIEAPDMGHAHSSGPRKGLALLYRDLPEGSGVDVVRHLDRLSDEVVGALRWPDRRVALSEAETSLCDFRSLVTGRYYVGHDIDKMQEQLTTVPSELSSRAVSARRIVLPRAYLGELSGRTGVDKNRRRVYLDTGKIVTR